MDDTRLAVWRVVTATAVLTVGAVLGWVLPLNLVMAFGLLVLLRICWLEDNIKNDLDGTSDLPANHLDGLRMRQRMAWHVLGLWPDPNRRTATPGLVASAMRGQIQAWSALLLVILAVTVGTAAGQTAVLTLVAVAVILRLAFRQADNLIRTLAHLDAGQPLSKDRLIPTHKWAYSTRAPRDDTRF